MADPESDASRDYFRNFIELYGYWLAEHNVVIKINDTVFVHGGLTESFAVLGLQAINNLYRSELQSAVPGGGVPAPDPVRRGGAALEPGPGLDR